MTSPDPRALLHDSRPARTAVVALLAGLACALACALAGWAASTVLGTDMPKWVLARSAGLTAYALLFAVTALGLLLALPPARRWRWPALVTRLRLHVGLAVFALVFTVAHVAVLALDPWSGSPWTAAVLPLSSAYRPVPVTLGMLGLWAGVLAGASAALAGRSLASKVWWPLHKGALLAFALVWAHGALAGSDGPALLLPAYLVPAAALLALALWRYLARTPDDVRAARSRSARAPSPGQAPR